jgi:glycosyltransferase involved in cell wall biosynthesis
MTDALTVILATDVFPPRCGGSGWSTYHLGAALRARGHRVIVARPRDGLTGTRLVEYDGLPVHEVGISALGLSLPLVRGVGRQERFWPRFARFLGDLARRENADILHGQHLLSIPAAVAAGRRVGVATVATVRDFWPTCPIGTRLRRCPELAHCSTACQVCCLARGQRVLTPLVRVALPFVRANLRRRQQALLHADRTIAVSRYVADLLRAGIPGLEPMVLPNFLRNAEVSESEVARDDDLVLYVGKLEEHKGADLLPAAMTAVPNARLVVAGDGPLLPEVRAACAGRGVRAEFLGERPNGEVLDLMRRAAVLLFPARWEEPLTRTLLEAGSMGLPAVALAVGGNADIIKDGVTGTLTSDPGALGPALVALLADPARRASMGAAARAHIAAKFTEDVVVPQVEQLYREIRR